MDFTSVVNQVAAWALEDRIRLVRVLLDALQADAGADLSEELCRELDRRIADMERFPEDEASWEEVKAELLSRP